MVISLLKRSFLYVFPPPLLRILQTFPLLGKLERFKVLVWSPNVVKLELLKLLGRVISFEFNLLFVETPTIAILYVLLKMDTPYNISTFPALIPAVIIASISPWR